MSDVDQLHCKGLSKFTLDVEGKGAHHANRIDALVLLYISHGLSIWHPFRHDLEGINGDAKTLEDIWMIQLRPHHNLPKESLRDAINGLPKCKGGFAYLVNLLHFYHFETRIL